MTKLKLIVVSLLALLSIYMAAPAASALYNPFGTSCDKQYIASGNNDVCAAANGQNGSTNNPISGPKGAIKEATNVFALITVIGGLVVAFYSAIVFVTAGGARAGDNASRARNARTTLVSALSGVAIASLAWLIVSYITTHIIH